MARGVAWRGGGGCVPAAVDYLLGGAASWVVRSTRGGTASGY